MKQDKKRSFFGGTALLMASGIAVKLIGAFFSIPLANLYGAEGNDIFISAYYVYAAMYVISSAGLPVAVSKLVAEARALGRGRELARIRRLTFRAFFVLGLSLTGLVAALSRPICGMIGSGCRYALLAVSPTILFTCMVSATRGYYQGLSNMIPTAVSQIVESLGKLLFGLGLAYWLHGRGYPLEIVVAGAIGGVTIGTMLSAVYVLVYRLTHREEPIPPGGACRGDRELLRELFRLAVPVTVGASVFHLSILIDTFMVKLRLQEKCFLTPAAAGFAYGAYGYAVKLFNLPMTLVVAIGVSLLPAVSASLAVGDRGRTGALIESAFRLTGLLAFPCAVGLAILPQPILGALFIRQDEAVALAAPLLRLLAPSVFLASMVSVTNPVLQAMGRPELPLRAMAAGAAVKAACNYVLVGIPEVGIVGVPVATGLSYLVMLLCNLGSIRRQKAEVSLRRAFARPLAAAALMGGFTALMWKPLERMLGSGLIAVLFCVSCSALFYGITVLACGAVPEEDIRTLPKGEKIVKNLKFRGMTVAKKGKIW